MSIKCVGLVFERKYQVYLTLTQINPTSFIGRFELCYLSLSTSIINQRCEWDTCDVLASRPPRRMKGALSLVIVGESNKY